MNLVFSNHKGGVGKTTSTLNTGAAMSRAGKQVLLIDIDPQANLSRSLGIQQQENTIYHALRGYADIDPVHITDTLHLVPSSLDLSAAEIELSAETGREYILRELLAPLNNEYDVILIDCPPSLGLLTINALAAADHVFIPIQAEFLALDGLAKLLDVIQKITKRINSTLQVSGIFITQYDKRKILNRDVARAIEEHFGDKALKTKIRNNIALAEAPGTGTHIFGYNEKANGAEDYTALCNEIIRIIDK
ncbi:ParA family protein [Prosthecochloris sp. N3]|uniref:ParA family protein n=1 Tax=Prosthecochloris ethylica TaxID=2743976 RepID=A0ABR9XPF9_9CHLB|nr:MULTISPECIES: ParA family protein [Prosthecochloris]MBF0586204.1 ParA family protein [Prosthecochloris ethylica]MBF0635910.1 ParA family protein [Prosthecochloris ethylica]NUK47415.1 ParA family protein [Prosthecochloris ethylica]RNA64965.1 ParA family protein [Prosthecochloris sp. ZM_2]